MKESKTLKEEMADFNKNFERIAEEKKTKKFKIPWRARVSKKNVKDGYATICYVNENNGVEFLKTPIQDGTIMKNGAPHLATTKYMLNYKNKPFLIVPSWNTKPFAPGQDLEDAAEKKVTTYGYRLLMNRLKSEMIKPKKQISMGLIIVIIVVIIAAGWYFTSGGGAA